MTTHLSVRLVWHDRGWDGHVCDAPRLNNSCIAHEHIRESRDDDIESRDAGTPFADLSGWLPPCSRDAAAYARRGYVITHRDPLVRQSPVGEEVPPYSCCPTPYRWMLEENFQEVCTAEDLAIRGPDKPKTNGWVYEPDRQAELLRHFWNKLQPKQSLVFYYCKGNPLDDSASRVIVGVGRISDIGDIQYFLDKAGNSSEYPVWSRRVTQDYPNQGVRIPYQEYLQSGHAVDGIICHVPKSALLDFSYVGEHVTDDVAAAILERVIQSIERVKADGYVNGNWDHQLTWLNDALSEVWRGRGAFPGIGSMLQYLGFKKGTAYQRAVLAPMSRQGSDPLKHALAILRGEIEPDEGPYAQGLLQARIRWSALQSRQALLAKLSRFELSPDQVERIANPDLHASSGITADATEIVDNPYVLAETDLGTKTSQPVALETIDHGMRPEGDAALFGDDDIAMQDDPRRVRAVSHAVLSEAAGNGDTVLLLSDLIERINTRFPERRACRPDREIIRAEEAFYSKVLWTSFDTDIETVALKRLRALEQSVSNSVIRRAARTNPSPTSINWLEALQSHFGFPNTPRKRAALEEKEKALRVLFERRLSILTGGAGTGKTSLLKVFLDRLEEIEGKQPTLLLAPTGKARVRLSTSTERNTMTIHQFLLRQGWFMPDSFVLKTENDRQPFKAVTVVIDECSMIPVDFLGTLLEALDMGPLKRLVLVGDPNQLPPIGPGRPFVDTIEWLKSKSPECIAALKVGMRKGDEAGIADGESVALAFADGYRSDQVHPGDDELLTSIARGESNDDLEVLFWNDRDDLLRQLGQKMDTLLGIGNKDYQSFNKSLGIDTNEWKRSEAWQILSSTRTQQNGTEDLNRMIQREYKGGLLVQSRNRWNKQPRPFGDQELVYTDKVIQTVNRGIKAWPRNMGLDYVANGEIGIVKSTRPDYLDVVFSTQSEVAYRYSRGDVNENLELAYALTVHKAQGSDFDIVFLIVPQSSTTLSRELIYTGLTRFRHRLVLLIEKDIAALLQFRNPEHSHTRLRNTQTFSLALRPLASNQPFAEDLIHRTSRGIAVRSKSEVIVANVLDSLGISYAYEQTLHSPSDSTDIRLPDFTVSYEGDTYYWEHLGMLSVPNYYEAWERKLQWYERNGFKERLITSEDGSDGSIDAAGIEQIARSRILTEHS